MRDGMTTEEISAHQALMGTGLASVVLSGADLAVAGGKVSATEIEGDAITASQIAANAVGASEQGFVGTGSPPAYQNRVLFGSGAIPTATSAIVTFGDTFLGAPNIVIGANKGGDIDVFAASSSAFLVSGTATTVYHWLAVGSA